MNSTIATALSLALLLAVGLYLARRDRIRRAATLKVLEYLSTSSRFDTWIVSRMIEDGYRWVYVKELLIDMADDELIKSETVPTKTRTFGGVHLEPTLIITDEGKRFLETSKSKGDEPEEGFWPGVK
jgi:hypothetical protein